MILLQKNKTLVQMIKYGIVGLAAFIVDYALLAFLTEVCNFHYLVSASIAFCVSIFVSYFGSIGWVFNNPETGNKARDVIVFFAIGLVGLGLTDLIMWSLTDGTGMLYLLAKVIATVVVFFWNFFARKLFLVRATKKWKVKNH